MSEVLMRVTAVDYEKEDGEVLVQLAGRDEYGERRTLYVEDTVPYFYAREDEVYKVEDHDDVRDIESGFESFDGIPLCRVYVRVPENAGSGGPSDDLTQEFSETWESDIPYYRRLTIDGLSGHIRVPDASRCRLDEIEQSVDVDGSELIDPRILIADIEVLQEEDTQFDELMEDFDCPISHISIWDSKEDEYIALHLDPENIVDPSEVSSLLDRHISSESLSREREKDIHLHSYESPEDLAQAFLSIIESRRPDLISGWNFVDFDWTYILNWFENIGVDKHRLSDIGWVNGYNVERRVDCLPAFDMMDAYRKMTEPAGDKKRSYALDYIGKEELGMGKIPNVNISRAFKTDRDLLVAYNILDTMLCVALDEVEGIHDFFYELAEISQVQIYDTFSEMRLIDGYIISQSGSNEILPSMEEKDIPENAGGLVLNPSSGVKDWIGVLDLKSLYPSDIITWNISTETIHWYEEEEPPEDTTTIDIPWMPDEGGDFGLEEIDFDVMWADLSKEGIIPRYLKRLFPEREEKKELRDQYEPGDDLYDVWDRKQYALKVLMNCFSSDTDIMTPNGIRNIKDVDEGDEVYSINPESMECEVKTVTDTTASENLYEEIEHITGNNIDLKITRNHKMLVSRAEYSGSSNREQELDYVEYEDLENSIRYEIPVHNAIPGVERQTTRICPDDCYIYIVPDEHGRTFKSELDDPLSEKLEYNSYRKGYRAQTSQLTSDEIDELVDTEADMSIQYSEKHSSIPVEYNTNDLLRLAGWYISEGSLDIRSGPRSKSSTRVQISQKTDEYRDEIESLLDRLGLEYSVSVNGITICNRIIHDWLKTNFGQYSEEKYISDKIYDLDYSHLICLWEAMMKGDGVEKGGYKTYSTKSDELKDDMAKLAVHIGYKPNIGRDSGVWRINHTEKSTFSKDHNSERQPHDERVYCITVEDNHTVMAGRNGAFQWTGQSFYGVSSNNHWRLGRDGLGDAITSAARYALWQGKVIAEDEGFEVHYGDTDSIMVELAGPEDGKEAALIRGERLEDRVNSRMDECVVHSGLPEGEEHPLLIDELHGTDRHALEYEFEKTYRRFFQAGTKKRYAGLVVWKEGKDVDGEIDMVGFESRRSDSPELTEDVQPGVISRILSGDGFYEVSDYISTKIDEIHTEQLEPYKVALPASLNQPLSEYGNTQTAKACRYSNRNLDADWSSGDDPWIYFIESTPPMEPGTDVLALSWDEDVPEGFKLDVEKTVERAIESPLKPILEEMEWRFTELKNGSRTQSAAEAGWETPEETEVEEDEQWGWG